MNGVCLLVDRYRFFDEEVLAPGENVNLYNGFLDSADSGAIVPTPTAPRTPDSRYINAWLSRYRPLRCYISAICFAETN